MATIKAFIRTSSKSKVVKIRLRLSDGRNFIRYGVTNIELPVDLWDAKKEEIKGRAILPDNIDRESINNTINDTKQLVLNRYNEIKSKDSIESDWIDSVIQNRSIQKDEKNVSSDTINFTELFDIFMQEAKVSENRKRQMKVARGMFYRYIYITKAEYMVIDNISEFERFMRDEYLIQKKHPTFYSNIKPIKQRSQNTLNSKLKIIGSFYRWAIKNKYLSNNPFSNYEYSPDVYGDPIPLLSSEVDLLYNSDLSGELALVRDMFCLQCYFGCRVNDFVNLKKENVEDDILIYIAKKTKTDRPVTIYVPIISKAKEIIERYNCEDGRLLPFINVNGKNGYNKRIKILAKHLGLDRKVAVINSLNYKTEIKPLYDVMTTHTARKTFINSNYKETQDPALISKMTGHSENSRAFARYRNIDMDILRSQMKKAFEKNK